MEKRREEMIWRNDEWKGDGMMKGEREGNEGGEKG